MNKQTSIIFVLLFFLLSTPLSVAAEGEVPKEVTKEQSYITNDENEQRDMKFDTEIVVKDKKYKLKDIKYETLSSTPITEKKEESKVVTTDTKPVEETYEPAKSIQENGITYNLVNTEKKEVTLQNAYTQTVSGTTTYQEKTTPPKTKTIKVKNKETGLEEEVTCNLVNVEELAAVWTDTQIDLSFQDYDADYYVFEGVEIPRNDTKPQLKGHEQAVLKSAGITDTASYKVLDVNWKGNAYEKDGVLVRDAVASCQRLVPKYQATYSGAIEIPEKKGMIYTTTYKGVTEVTTDKTEYEKKAVASYQLVVKKQNITTTILISLAIVVIFLFIILWIIKMRKSKKIKDN